jgi:hypothetical protein
LGEKAVERAGGRPEAGKKRFFGRVWWLFSEFGDWAFAELKIKPYDFFRVCVSCVYRMPARFLRIGRDDVQWRISLSGFQFLSYQAQDQKSLVVSQVSQRPSWFLTGICMSL